MNTWKHAWQLTKFEFRTTPPSYVGMLFMLGFGLFLFVSTLTNGEEQATLGTEWLFFLTIVAFPYLMRSEHIRGKNIGNREWASPQLAFTLTLPISHKTLATYRMVSYITMTFMFNSIFFTLLYALSPYMRTIAPIGTYVVFAIMWICIAIYMGGFQVHAEAGFYVLTYVFSLFFIFVPLAIIVSVLLFYKTYTKGLIQWMLDLAAAYPLIVVIGSIVLAILGTAYHIWALMRKMAKTNY